MYCFNDDNADLLIGYFENTLSEVERSTVDAHVAGCESCRELLQLHATLDAYAVPEVSSDFDQRLYARIAADQVRPWWHMATWMLATRSWKLAIPLTAVATMLAVGVFMVGHQQPAPVDDAGKISQNDLKAQNGKVLVLDKAQLDKALDEWELMLPLQPDQGNI